MGKLYGAKEFLSRKQSASTHQKSTKAIPAPDAPKSQARGILIKAKIRERSSKNLNINRHYFDLELPFFYSV
jgi:hypothetical protein